MLIRKILILAATAAVVSTEASILITQYYEGLSNDKYIELTNIGNSAVDFSSTPYTLALYSNANRELWKSGGSFNSSQLLSSGSLAVGASLVFKNSSAANPPYASALGTSSAITNFNGDDSIVLFSGNSTAYADVSDAFGLTGSGYADKSFVRIDFNPTNLDFNASLWQEFTLADVANAGLTDSARLGYSPVPEPSTYAALAGLGALVLVVMRRRRR